MVAHLEIGLAVRAHEFGEDRGLPDRLVDDAGRGSGGQAETVSRQGIARGYNAVMDKQAVLTQELSDLDEAGVDEVISFVRRLKASARRRVPATALASERVLAADWLRPEEDEAWSDL